MSEHWGKDIIEARTKLKSGKTNEGINILMDLVKSENQECRKESQKILIKELSQIKNKKALAKAYLEELYKEDKNIQNSIQLRTLSAQVGDLSDLKKYYNESLALMESQKEITSTLFYFIYFELLVVVRNDFNDTYSVILKLVESFKKINILDHHFLITRKFPSFYKFISTVDKFYLNNNKKGELIEFLKDQLSWVDESGKEVISEVLIKYS